MPAIDRVLLDPDTPPPAILHRDTEQAFLREAVADAGQHLYVHGPRGAGKTLLVRDALTTSTPTRVYYLSCIPHNTQYKVLNRLYERVTDDALNPGYHTAQLQQRIAHQLRDTTTLLVLDDLSFLLENDGNDLLYVLSRLNDHTDLGIIGIGTQSSLADMLDERTYSSLRPQSACVEPYADDEAVDILSQRVDAALPPDTVEPAALEYIAATTTNLTLGLHWLTYAATHATNITADVVQDVQAAALQRYRNALLQGFTSHHTVLLEAIDQATDGGTSATTGTVYETYVKQCRATDNEPLTPRRISDYLTHLELLNLIDVTHHEGGETGKTRDIRPTPLQQL